jgi:uncharacterized protein (DUF58 family)
MIVPRTRLLVAAGLLAPVLGLAGALPGIEGPGLGGPLGLSPAGMAIALVLGLFVLLTGLDALTARGRLSSYQVHLPGLIRLTKDRDGSFSVHLHGEPGRAVDLRVGLLFPPEITAPETVLAVRLPAQTADVRFPWPCRPSRRGRFFFDKCHLEAPSPLGLWAIRRSLPAKAEIRVYPNLMAERKNLAALFLGRGSVGIHAQRQVGKGRDFEKLREYLPGDGYEDIHWKATAKRLKPVTKVYQIEKTQEVYVILDASRLSARPAGRVSERRLAPRPDGHDTSILERFITTALIMAQAAQRQGDLYGLVTFSDRVLGFLRAKNGKTHYDACREVLYTLEPQRVAPDFDELFSFLSGRLRRRALLIFLTNVDDPVLAESFSRSIQVVARRHLVFVNMIRPPMARPLFSEDTVKTPDDIYRELGGHYLWNSLRETERVLQRRGVSFATVDNETLATELVAQYLRVKQRQRL